VDIDILNLGTHQDMDAVTSLIAESNVINHETEADLESYRVELQELQDEVDALKTRKQQIEQDISMCGQFVDRATLYTAAISGNNTSPKAGNSKWGLLKTSILSKSDDTFAVLPPNSVHLPVQPEFAKFFYLSTKLEMARRTSKFLGIRAKGPRTEYVENCTEMRSVIVDAATQRAEQMSEDIAVLQRVNADAMRSTLSILEPPPVDRPFSSYLEIPVRRQNRENLSISPPPPVSPAPPAPATPVRHASVSFAPPPPPSSQGTSTPAPAPVQTGPPISEQEYRSAATPRRRSILHDFRSRSYAATMIRSDTAYIDPTVAAFNNQVSALVQTLPTEQEIHSLLTSASTPRCAIESEDTSMYREALQAHCEETLDSFHAEMERKMKDCVELCAEALARRNGPLSSMKGEILFVCTYLAIL